MNKLVDSLSKREKEVYLQLVTTSWKKHEIAAKLCIAAGTVTRHQINICDKLGYDSRLELMLDYWENLDK